MKLRIEYTIKFLSAPPEGFTTPIFVSFEDREFRVDNLDMQRLRAMASAEMLIDASDLRLRHYPDTPAGSGHPPEIEVKEKQELSAFLSNQLNILSFIIDAPIGRALNSQTLIPNSESDEELLDKLGTRAAYSGAHVTMATRTFWLREVTPEFLASMMDKESGVALYSQALLCQEHVATFREYWKVLESAFGAQDEKLIMLLADYEPARELEFTEVELRELDVLRGRASHAQSKSGVKEYAYVQCETSKRLSRLKCLVEQILLTKKTWGVPTLEVERLVSLWGYVQKGGGLVFINQS